MNENKNVWANMYLQKENKINGRTAWFYLISTSIGNIAIVEYEQKDLSIKRKIIDENYDKAEKLFDRICKQMIDGKI